jgi:hypothetical protein
MVNTINKSMNNKVKIDLPIDFSCHKLKIFIRCLVVCQKSTLCDMLIKNKIEEPTSMPIGWNQKMFQKNTMNGV